MLTGTSKRNSFWPCFLAGSACACFGATYEPQAAVCERPLRRAIGQLVEHFHRERTKKCRHEAKNHQGIENVIPFPNAPQGGHDSGLIVKSERLGGLLNYYYRENRKEELLVA